ncbi:DUF4123 domain-containing protein [uncultured Litoreibacter sp.]|uniref:DUF4123 domain-containing protein n=1 Tax=uncultured Litoreibacter sp. TaxID=1392394 RepID=UPI0026391F2E|nr:DUF4123 domain-containing protein [uncultured Litoreibacter sp.]
MSANTELNDYWTQQYSPQETPSDPLLNIENIENVEPLDAQFGVADPKTVPDALYAPVFGQPEPLEFELEQAEGDPAAVPPLHTYAILDAAKVPSLPELLATSGLDHRCLFKGDAFDELKDVAPWIVRLEADHKFTRNLFTRSKARWHLWDAEPGIYLRSRGTLDDMWAHFRKFTKVQDENGKWFYFRFWEILIGEGFEPDVIEQDVSLFGPLFLPNRPSVSSVIMYRVGLWKILKRTSDSALHEKRWKFNAQSKKAITRLKVEADLHALAHVVMKSIPPERGSQRKELRTRLVATGHLFLRMGYKQREHIAKLMTWEALLGPDFIETYANGEVAQIVQSANSAAVSIDRIKTLLQKDCS